MIVGEEGRVSIFTTSSNVCVSLRSSLTMYVRIPISSYSNKPNDHVLRLRLKAGTKSSHLLYLAWQWYPPTSATGSIALPDDATRMRATRHPINVTAFI